MIRVLPITLLFFALLLCGVGADQTNAQTLGGQVGAMKIQEELHSGKASRPAQDRDLRDVQNKAPTDQAKNPGSWPNIDLNPSGKGGDHGIDRGPGGYVSWLKLALGWLLFVLWVRTTDWVNQDCYRHRLNYGLWNSIAFYPFFVAFILMWILPAFVIAFSLMTVAYLGSIIAYIVVRNRAVSQHQRMLTPEHLRYLFATTLNKFGANISVEQRADHEKGAQVDLQARGGKTDRDNNVNLLTARQSPGYVLVKNLLADAMDWRSAAVRIEFSGDSATIRYRVDGVWRDSEVLQREAGDVVVAVLKTLCDLDINERSKRQIGLFGAVYEGTKKNCRLLVQQTKKEEQVTVRIDDIKPSYHTLADLGMRDKLSEQLLGFIGNDKGFVVFSALPESGLTTTMDVSLHETDRLMRNFVSIEPETMREREIENVEVTTYQPAAGETPATVLPKLIRTYPDVIVVRNLSDPKTANILCQQVKENRLILTSIRAKEAPEALLRVLMLKVPAKELAPAVTAVINQRLIRCLCDECKVAYEPTPDVLQKLRIPEGRISALYREPTAEEANKPCPACRGLGYFGRVSIFELLVVDEEVREMLLNQPNLTKARQVARKIGMRSLQEEGIVLVAKGITSVAELTRVLNK